LAELLIKSGTIKPGYNEYTKGFSLDFLLSPIQFNGSSPKSAQLGSIDFQENQYRDDTEFSDPRASVTPSKNSAPIQLPASVAFRSIGYKAEPLPGLSAVNVPFDHQQSTILNQLGRIISPSVNGIDVTPPVPGMYVAGWAKRGPTGVIASTMEDAFGTADNILYDLKAERPFLNHEAGGSTGLGWEGVRKDAEQRGLRRTSWADWLRIDGVERERGKKLGKEREKMTDLDEMLSGLDS